MSYDIVIVGGFGHVGLPLGLAFADKGKKVCAYDINKEVEKIILSGKMPFIEYGAEEVLKRVLENGNFSTSTNPEVISMADTVIIVIGTPVDEHLNPKYEQMRKFIEDYIKYFRDGQLVVLRSTVYPGTTEKLYQWFLEKGKKIFLAFCPERIAEGYAMKELYELPQIVAGTTPQATEKASKLFSLLTPEIVILDRPLEAELAKLFTNVWRYVKFAVANEFFMIATEKGVDFYKIYHAITYKYPRAQDLPKPGFSAGPCLFKDTMQLAAYNDFSFSIGHAAMLVNEGLPNYIVSKLKQKYNLKEKVVGILGMAFKANIDDPRESLAYKLRKILLFEAKEVLCSDPYIKDERFVSEEELIRRSDIIILATPHKVYRDLKIGEGKVVVDVWNFFGNGSGL